MPGMIDLRGKQFNRWTVLDAPPLRSAKKLYWYARCACGSNRWVYGSCLRTGHVKSCGCLYTETRRTCHASHGLGKPPGYTSWKAMRKRCRNPKDSGWDRYGGRGIKVCEWWQSFPNFLADMGERPSDLHTLDRIDPNGDYEPGNCRWALPEVQTNNKRSNFIIEWRGRRQTCAEWCRELDLNYEMTRQRVHEGETLDDVLAVPKRKTGPKPCR